MKQGDLFDPQPHRVPLADMVELVHKSQEPCPYCHCRTTLLPHRICKRKIEVLATLAQYLRAGDEWVRVETGRGLQGSISKKWTTTAYRASEHVARLEWYGLAERQGHRSGLWRILPAGLRFLRGELAVPAKILTTQGRTIYVSEETVLIDDVRGVDLDKAYWDAYPWADFLDQEPTS
ncbi:MAG: hypothetical protein HKN46_09495 [Acidimicrobiia bacterium]|nr:hypothetical protein [Acidimicrobiia bacterium]